MACCRDHHHRGFNRHGVCPLWRKMRKESIKRGLEGHGTIFKEHTTRHPQRTKFWKADGAEAPWKVERAAVLLKFIMINTLMVEERVNNVRKLFQPSCMGLAKTLPLLWVEVEAIWIHPRRRGQPQLVRSIAMLMKKPVTKACKGRTHLEVKSLQLRAL
jgi:hypothetical protein